jgi:hypothetical protein
MSEQQRNAIKDRGVTRMSDDTFHSVDNRPLAPDVLKGIREITLFTEGTDDKSAIRGMYHRTLKSSTVPTYKWGSMTCARKSAIRAKIWSQESRAWKGALQEDLVRVHILLSSILTSLAEPNEHTVPGHDRTLSPLMAEAARTIQRVLSSGGA